MFKKHKNFLISTTAVIALGLISLWLSAEIQESSKLMNSIFKKVNWSEFLNFAPEITLLLMLVASLIPLQRVFGPKMGSFSKGYAAFLIIWLFIQVTLTLVLISPLENVKPEFIDWLISATTAISLLPAIVGYVVLCFWFGYIIANTAARKGKSWDSFFWLTILFGPLIMWIVVSLLTPEEIEARGTVRHSQNWVGSSTKALTASQNSLARLIIVLSGGLVFLSSLVLLSNAQFVVNEVAQPANSINEISFWLLGIELVAFAAYNFNWSWKPLFARIGLNNLAVSNWKNDPKSRWIAIGLMIALVVAFIATTAIVVSANQESAPKQRNTHSVSTNKSCAGSISKECGATFVTGY